MAPLTPVTPEWEPFERELSSLEGEVFGTPSEEYQDLPSPPGTPNVYGWYYDEWGNLINGETGETFANLDWETQDLFYRDVLASVGLTVDPGTGATIAEEGATSPEIEKWAGSLELETWALDQAQANWENQVVQSIEPRNVDDPRRPQRTVEAPWDGPADAVPTTEWLSVPEYWWRTGPDYTIQEETPFIPHPYEAPTPLPEFTYTEEESEPEFHEAPPVAPAFNLSRTLSHVPERVADVYSNRGQPFPSRHQQAQDLYRQDMLMQDLRRERANQDAIKTAASADRILVRGAPHHRASRPPARKELPSWMLNEVLGIR